ncbi:prophage regulatory protein [Bradyrhizobium sp. USDA 3311]
MTKAVVTFKQLKTEFGIPYCRAHIDRLEDPDDPCYDPDFPKSFKLGRGRMARRVWWQHEIIAWLEIRATRRNDLPTLVEH